MGPCVNGRVHLAFTVERENTTLFGACHDLSKWDRMNSIVGPTSTQKTDILEVQSAQIHTSAQYVENAYDDTRRD